MLNASRFALLCALIFIATPVSALDKNRQGFVLGLGAGFHHTNIRDNGVPFYDVAQDESEESLSTSFRLGFGFNEHFLMYLSNDVNWYTEDIESDPTTVSLAGLGMSYYITPSPETVYLTAAYGRAERDELIGTSNLYRGNGFSVGVGYEFARWLSFQADYMNLSMRHTDYSQFTKDARSFRLSFQANFY